MDDAEQAACEALLKGLVPAPISIDRDRLMFRAGRASLPRRGWAWPCATAGLAVVSVALGAVLWLRPEPRPVERTVYVKTAAPAPHAPYSPTVTPAPAPKHEPIAEAAEPPVDVANYLHVRGQVLRWGVDALPAPPTPSTSPRLYTPADTRDPTAPAFDGTRLFRRRPAPQLGGLL
jgi:hypothetical protein